MTQEELNAFLAREIGDWGLGIGDAGENGENRENGRSDGGLGRGRRHDGLVL